MSDAEWTEALRASRLGALRYILLSREFLYGPLAMFLGAFCYHLYSGGGNVFIAFDRTVRGGIFMGFAFFVVFLGIRRARDWRGKRQLVFRQPIEPGGGTGVH